MIYLWMGAAIAWMASAGYAFYTGYDYAASKFESAAKTAQIQYEQDLKKKYIESENEAVKILEEAVQSSENLQKQFEELSLITDQIKNEKSCVVDQKFMNKLRSIGR